MNNAFGNDSLLMTLITNESYFIYKDIILYYLFLFHWSIWEY